MLISLFKKVGRLVGIKTEEDRVIDLFKRGIPQPFIDYFNNSTDPLRRLDHRRQASKSGRVIYEDDIYSYVYVDGKWIDRYQWHMPYAQRRAFFDAAETAVLSNAYGTIMYDEKYINGVLPH